MLAVAAQGYGKHCMATRPFAGLVPLNTALSMRIVRIARQYSPKLQGVGTWMKIHSGPVQANIVLRQELLVDRHTNEMHFAGKLIVDQ